ncbi:MAG: Gfo/Idh/MocA family oxidoreductase [Steroidobacteraceae bacterium]
MTSDNRRLRAGIVGGGRGAFIGSVHRMAAELDGQATIIAGALSADPETARQSAAVWNLERSYDSYAHMAEAEAQRNDGIDFVIVATPNHLHYPVARCFLEAGIHVVCDKPLAHSLEEGLALAALVDRRQRLFALTHNYTGYPAIRQARALMLDGALGELRKVMVEYTQDWLMERVEDRGSKQAGWRTDPARAGLAGCVGDIGTHAENLLQFVTGRKISELCADLSTFVAGRRLDDDANMLLRLEGGAKGTLVCSQIACGEENHMALRIYGTQAGLEWCQADPGTLIYKPKAEPWSRQRAGHGYLAEAARRASRLPPGHPEGYLEAFANLYGAFIEDVRRVAAGLEPYRNYPTVDDGVRGLRFIAAAVESSRGGGRWVSIAASG